MLDTGYWILDTGYWILDTRYWILDTRSWILPNPIVRIRLDAGFGIRDAGAEIERMENAGYGMRDSGYDQRLPKSDSYSRLTTHDSRMVMRDIGYER